MSIWDEYMWAMKYAEGAGFFDGPNRMEEVLADVKCMHKAWNVAEFGGELNTVPVIPLFTPLIDVDERLEPKGVLLGYYAPSALGNGAIFLCLSEAVMEARRTRRTFYHSMADTLLHEMCHQYACEHGVEDAEADGTHTAAFRDVAREHGLVCHIGSQGWNRTTVRKGHFAPFYGLVSPDIARKMRTTHVGGEDEE